MYQKGPRLDHALADDLCLPHPDTLDTTMKEVELLPGMRPGIKKMLQRMGQKMKHLFQDCIILADEIHLKHGFSYDKKRDRTTGVVDHGEFGREEKPAKSALVYMLRSIYGNWKIPIAYYLTNSTDGKTLAKLTTKIVEEVEDTPLRIRAMVCDAVSTNKAMYRALGASKTSPFFNIKGRKIYALFDPPHLLKAIRNCLLEYVIHSGKDSYDWADIVAFYNVDKEMKARIAPKLTEVHLDPNSLEKMSVAKATQIFSSQVAAGMFTHASYSK